MALTLTQIRGVVKTAIALRSDVTDAQINTYINLSQERIARQHVWDELNQGPTDLTLVITSDKEVDKTVSISSLTNLRSLVRIVLEDAGASHPLEWLPPRQFDTLVPLPEHPARSRPYIYTRWGNNLLLYPVPVTAHVLRIRWINWPAALSADGDIPALTHKDDMIIFLTCSFVFALLREEEQANRFWGYYQNELKVALAGEEHDAPDANIVRPNFSVASMSSGAAHLDPWNKIGNS